MVRPRTEVPSSATDTLAAAARVNNLPGGIGVIERDGGTLYCTALFFSPEGRLLRKHRKLMPTDIWGRNQQVAGSRSIFQ